MEDENGFDIDEFGNRIDSDHNMYLQQDMDVAAFWAKKESKMEQVLLAKESATDYISLKDCVKGHCYRIRSRNLTRGVFDGVKGFIGIREKFGERYLFTEFHWDSGAPHGTVQPIEDLGLIPQNIEVESGRTIDQKTSKQVYYIPGSGPPFPGASLISEGHYAFTDGTQTTEKIVPVDKPNVALFDFLDGH